MNKLELADTRYITIASGTRFKDTGKKIKLCDFVYYTDNEGNVETGAVFDIIDRPRQDIIFYSTKEACEPEQKEKINLMQEKIQNAIQIFTKEINSSILQNRKDGWVDYAFGDEGLHANSYDGFTPNYTYGYGATINFYITDIYNCINEEHEIELQKNIDYAEDMFWSQLKSKLKCRSLEKYLKKLNETENHDLLEDYDLYIEGILQEFTGKILTRVTYYSKNEYSNKIKEDFIRVDSWIQYEDRIIKYCFDKIYNVDDFLHLVDNEIDDLGDVIFETLNGQPIIST